MELPDITFGIELEVSDSNGDFSYDDACDGDSCRGFELKSDGSVGGDELEFVSPILRGPDGLAAVDNFCTYATRRGWECDESCGYHLHIGVADYTDLQRRKIAQGYVLAEKFFLALCRNREGSQWCMRFPESVTGASIEETRGRREGTSNAFERVIREATRYHGRYVWCNLSSYRTHGTIEIRLHAGTVDPVAVTNWIKLHLAFVAKMTTLKNAQIRAMFTGKTGQQMFEAIAEFVGDADLMEYYRRKGGFRAVTTVAEAT